LKGSSQIHHSWVLRTNPRGRYFGRMHDQKDRLIGSAGKSMTGSNLTSSQQKPPIEYSKEEK